VNVRASRGGGEEKAESDDGFGEHGEEDVFSGGVDLLELRN